MLYREMSKEVLSPPEPVYRNGFPEPRAVFIYPDASGGEKRSELTLSELQERIVENRQKLRKAQHIRNGLSVRPTRHGRRRSRREIRDIAEEQRRQRLRELERMRDLLEVKSEIIFHSDPADPLIIRITSKGDEVLSGSELPAEEREWRRHLVERGFTGLWAHPLIGLAREFFSLRLAASQADTPSKEKEAKEALKAFIREKQDNIPEDLIGLFSTISNRFPIKGL